MAIQERMITVGGLPVRLYEDGAQHAPHAILLLHSGYGSAWVNWEAAIPLLADDYHVIAPDLPGYGQSAALPRMTIEELALWCQGVMDALGIEQAVVVGSSFGGLIGRIFAAMKPTYVPALILVNGGVIPSVPAMGRLIARVPFVGQALFNRLARSSLSRANLELGIKTPGVLTDSLVSRMLADVAGLARLMRAFTLSQPPQARVPRIPVLLLWGEEDAITPRIVAEHIQSHIPASRISLIAEVGHLPQIEVPEVFASQVKQFLRELTRPRRPTR